MSTFINLIISSRVPRQFISLPDTQYLMDTLVLISFAWVAKPLDFFPLQVADSISVRNKNLFRQQDSVCKF